MGSITWRDRKVQYATGFIGEAIEVAVYTRRLAEAPRVACGRAVQVGGTGSGQE